MLAIKATILFSSGSQYKFVLVVPYGYYSGDEDGILDMATRIGNIKPFRLGKEDWEQYVERFEQYVVANNVEEGRRVATFLTMMGADAYSLLSNLLAPDKPKDKDYSQLVDAMTRHLKPKPLIIAERFKFHCRGQGKHESVSDYMAELRRLADKCRFG